MTAPRIPKYQLVFYALPAFTTTMLVLPTFTVMPAFYAKFTSLTLEQVGLVLLLARIFDGISDPLIGLLSERTSSPIGKRKPWMIAGAMICAGSAYSLFSPPADAGMGYFLGWSLILYLAWTMIEIPYSAWGAELSDNYNERTTIVTFRIMAGSIGSLIFLSAPLFPGFESQEFDPEVMSTFGLVLSVLLPVCVMAAVFLVPSKTTQSEPVNIPISRFYGSMLKNKIFCRFLLAFALAGIAGGIYNGLLYLFVDSFLGIGHLYPYLAIALFVSTWVALPPWLYVMKFVGKHRGWVWGALFATVLTPLLAFAPPGPDSLYVLVPLISLIGIGWAAHMVAPYSIMADIIEYDEFKSGVNQGSNYFAVFSLLTKSCAAIGGGFAFLTIGLFGYEVNVENDGLARSGFLITMLGLPPLLNLLMVATLWRFPLDERRQGIIRRRLSSLRTRSGDV